MTVKFGEDSDSASTASLANEDYSATIGESEARFWYRAAGTFIVKNGREIIISPNGKCDIGMLRLYVQGMIMAMILHQRGMCVLHASVIEMNGAAVACLGHIGAGKSSTAAALYARGHRVLTDDNAAISLDSGEPIVVPGYPSVKLYPAIAASLGVEESRLGPLHSSQLKVVSAADGGFTDRVLPLKTIYILGRNHDPVITPVSPIDATVQMLLNAVPTRWGHRGDARQLRQCAAIANRVSVFAIRTFREISELPGLVGQLEQHQKDLSEYRTSSAN